MEKGKLRNTTQWSVVVKPDSKQKFDHEDTQSSQRHV
jgi:hypothetical protein